MNRDIAKLAERPRGRKWRSRLVAFDADIRRMRKEQVSYKAIATWISDHGLPITGSAVHAYVRARARQRRGLYTLPCPSTGHPLVQSSSPAMRHEDELDVHPLPIEKPELAVSKKFIFSPNTQAEEHFDDKKFTFHDPLDPNHEHE